MLKWYSFFIGLRYTRAKTSNGFISFVSLSSMLGIALGVMVLITVMSVMNGFTYEIQQQLLKGMPHLRVQTFDQALSNWGDLAKTLKQSEAKLIGLSPFITGQGLLLENGQFNGLQINGIELASINEVLPLKTSIIQGSLAALGQEKYGIVLGESLVQALGLKLHDKLNLLVPDLNSGSIGLNPRSKRFTLCATYKLSSLYDYSQAYIRIQDADVFLRRHGLIDGLNLQAKHAFEAPTLRHNLVHKFESQHLFTDWTQSNQNFFQAIRLQKTVMVFVLFLIIAVASFNLVSSLVMMVKEKHGNIAVLRAMGASTQDVLSIFIVQGFSVGCLGTLLGILIGSLLAQNITRIYRVLDTYFKLGLIQTEVYQIDFLPSRFEWADLLTVALTSLGMCLLATLYPAYSAAKIQPAEALRYE